MGNSLSDSKTPNIRNRSIFDYSVEDKFGKEVSLKEKFSGSGKRCYIVVNVASQCGLTASNYKELVEIYDKYSERGLEICAFPCNNFGQQEKGTNEECAAFAERKKAKFPVFGKIECSNGEKTHPLFVMLAQDTDAEFCGMLGQGMKWNFTKFLVDSNGIPVKRFSPIDSPKSMEPAIEALLGAANASAQ